MGLRSEKFVRQMCYMYCFRDFSLMTTSWLVFETPAQRWDSVNSTPQHNASLDTTPQQWRHYPSAKIWLSFFNCTAKVKGLSYWNFLKDFTCCGIMWGDIWQNSVSNSVQINWTRNQGFMAHLIDLSTYLSISWFEKSDVLKIDISLTV